MAWLLVEPVRAEGHRDWVILVGTYFESFILADVTTTNVLGVDHIRIQNGLRGGIPASRILLVKTLRCSSSSAPHPRGSGDIDPGNGDTRSALDQGARGRGADAFMVGRR